MELIETNFPPEMIIRKQWVVWKLEKVDERETKVPYSPLTQRPCSVIDSSKWVSFEDAVAAVSDYSGIGFVFTQNDPYTFIDLDKPENDEQFSRHSKIIQAFEGAYAEISQSGNGVHLIVKAILGGLGHRRDKVEIYDRARFMAMTGNLLWKLPEEIPDMQATVDVLYREILAAMDFTDAASARLFQKQDTLTDQEVFDAAISAMNGDKFDRLCKGMISDYPSHSEADLALMSILAYYSQSDDQVMRLFSYSALAQRDKARRKSYMMATLTRVRKEHPVYDVQDLLKKDINIHPTNIKVIEEPVYQMDYPPGHVGELARFFYGMSIRPVREISIAAALALTAGITGRAYNVSNTGLNQYFILLAKTGTGKEAAQTCMEFFLTKLREQFPNALDFLGPSAFASGQGLLRNLSAMDNPAVVSVLGEFGITLKNISNANASTAHSVLKQVLLDLYGKSGWDRLVRPMVYSDTEKNTETIHAPALSILGESTPEGFYDGLTEEMIAEGLISRFAIIEYKGDRPKRNHSPTTTIPDGLFNHYANLMATVMATTTAAIPVKLSAEAEVLFNAFDDFCDHKINSTPDSGICQLWNRAHLKALKIASILSTSYDPTITKEAAEWSISFVREEVVNLSRKFNDNDGIGYVENVQLNDFIRTIKRYAVKHANESPMIIAKSYLQPRIAQLKSFKEDKMGAAYAFNRCINITTDTGLLIEVEPLKRVQLQLPPGRAYYVNVPELDQVYRRDKLDRL